MSFLFSKKRLIEDKWMAPTRREIGYGMQFLAVGLSVGYAWGVAYGNFSAQSNWFPFVFIGLILVGGRLIRSKSIH
jgi:hypothetical protein